MLVQADSNLIHSTVQNPTESGLEYFRIITVCAVRIRPYSDYESNYGRILTVNTVSTRVQGSPDSVVLFVALSYKTSLIVFIFDSTKPHIKISNSRFNEH